MSVLIMGRLRFVSLFVVIGFLAGCAVKGQIIPDDPYADRRSNRTPQSVMAGAAGVLQTWRAQTPDAQTLEDQSYGILVFPKLVRIGIGFAGQQGPGVLLTRQEGTWRGPLFQWYRSATYGLQAGLQHTDMVLVIQDQDTYDVIRAEQLTLNLDAQATVGSQSTGTQWSTLALGDGLKIYVKGRGGFAGVGGGIGQISYDNFWTGKYFNDWQATVEQLLSRTGSPRLDGLF